MKVYICCKSLSNRFRIKKSAFKNQKPTTPYLIARRGNRKSIKVIKALCVKCAPLIGIAKGTVIAHDNKCSSVTYEDSH